MTEHADMTVDQLAALIAVNPETVRVYIRRGEYPGAYLLPGRGGYRIPWPDVEAFKARHRELRPSNPRENARRYAARSEAGR